MDDSNLLPPNAIDATSSRLLSDARRDDANAWNELVFLYSPVVRFWISRGGVKSKADIADIAQEVFLAVSKNLKQFQRQPGEAKFRSWLKVVSASKINDHFRQGRKLPQALGGSTAALLIGNLADQEYESLVLDTIGRPEDTRETEESLLTQRVLQSLRSEFRDTTWKAFWRTAVDGQNATQVAEELGVTSTAVRKAKSRVLSRLREALAEMGLG